MSQVKEGATHRALPTKSEHWLLTHARTGHACTITGMHTLYLIYVLLIFFLNFLKFVSKSTLSVPNMLKELKKIGKDQNTLQ